MFKKAVVSVVLGISLMSSIVLWAKSSEDAQVVAKLDVTQQLSISEHNLGEGDFIQQVREQPKAIPFIPTTDDVPMPLLPALGVMVFGLMYFVLRSSRNRIK